MQDNAFFQAFSFYGRTTRLGWLIYNILGGLLLVPFFVGLHFGHQELTAIGFLIALPGLLIGFASHIRRLRDIGLSSWFSVFGLIPMTGTVMMFVYLLIPGKAQD